MLDKVDGVEDEELAVEMARDPFGYMKWEARRSREVKELA